MIERGGKENRINYLTPFLFFSFLVSLERRWDLTWLIIYDEDTMEPILKFADSQPELLGQSQIFRFGLK